MNQPGSWASLLRNAHCGVDFEYPALLVAKELILSVTLKDCEVQHFRSGGPGGQHQNKTSSGTRVIHHPSGARGESRQEREQPRNTKIAFRRMAESGAFKAWVRKQSSGLKGTPEERVEKDMDPKNLLIMAQDNGKWSIID